EAGLIVPPGDPQALAGAIRRLIQDPQAASRLGAAARERVRERFSLKKTAEDHVSLFHRVLVPLSAPTTSL
ncbi:MAG: glycosyltransferase, partial [Planctomycetales bacterium]